jgi:hypothetical protein
LDLVATHDPSLVILDLALPGIDGQAADIFHDRLGRDGCKRFAKSLRSHGGKEVR